MSRPLRIEYPGAFYHVVQRGLEKRFILKRDRDKERLIKYVKEGYKRFKIIVHAYCIMDNHYHLLIETMKANLSKVMHYLNTSYARFYNVKYSRVGPLFQGRYNSKLVDSDEYLHCLSKYIHNNPVRAKMAKVPEEYRWSSCSAYLGMIGKPEWLEPSMVMNHFGRKKSEQIKGYREFLEMEEKVDRIKEGTYRDLIIGSKQFVEDIVNKYIDKKEDEEVPQIRQVKSIQEITFNEISDIIIKFETDKKLARKYFVYMAKEKTDKTLKEIGNYRVYEDAKNYWSISKIYQRFRADIGQDKQLRLKIMKIGKEIDRKMSNVQT